MVKKRAKSEDRFLKKGASAHLWLFLSTEGWESEHCPLYWLGKNQFWHHNNPCTQTTENCGFNKYYILLRSRIERSRKLATSSLKNWPLVYQLWAIRNPLLLTMTTSGSGLQIILSLLLTMPTSGSGLQIFSFPAPNDAHLWLGGWKHFCSLSATDIVLLGKLPAFLIF